MVSDGLNQKTREHYDALIPSLSGDYVEYRWRAGPVQRSHYRHTRRAIRIAFEQAGRFQTLLEVGPGPGTWTDLCLAYSNRVTLCDISREMLKAARQHFGSSVDYVEGDFTSTQTAIDGGYEAVVSFRALEYMSSKSVFVDRAHQHLTPGGLLMVITKNPGWRDKRAEHQTREIHRDWISSNELAGMVRNAGFRDVGVFPVAVGSYQRPFNNRLGVAACDVWQRLIVGRAMRGSWNGLVESYLLTARKR